MGRRSRDREKKHVKVDDAIHKTLKKMQREMKKNEGIEPSLGELIERGLSDSPAFEELIEETRKEREEEKDPILSESFMKL